MVISLLFPLSVPIPALNVHRWQLPPLGRVLHASLESFLLHIITHTEPIFDDVDPTARQTLFENRTWIEKFRVFFLGAKPHDFLHACAIIPKRRGRENQRREEKWVRIYHGIRAKKIILDVVFWSRSLSFFLISFFLPSLPFDLPRPVHQNHFPCSRKLIGISLEIPLTLLPFARCP